MKNEIKYELFHVVFVYCRKIEKVLKSLDQQGFDKDGSRKPVKSRLCRQQADGAFIKNEYEDGKRRILRFASFSIGLSALP